jgi:hypothetical protein
MACPVGSICSHPVWANRPAHERSSSSYFCPFGLSMSLPTGAEIVMCCDPRAGYAIEVVRASPPESPRAA